MQSKSGGNCSAAHLTYFTAVRRAGEFAFYDRMLRLWHILHLPLFFILIATASAAHFCGSYVLMRFWARLLSVLWPPACGAIALRANHDGKACYARRIEFGPCQAGIQMQFLPFVIRARGTEWKMSCMSQRYCLGYPEIRRISRKIDGKIASL